MKIKNPQYKPNTDLTKQEMKDLQEKISKEASFKDEINQANIIAGIDQAFTEDKIISGIVIINKQDETINKYNHIQKVNQPYIPGLLAFREAPAILNLLKKVDESINLLFIDGGGRIHYREAGIATHIGVLLEKPTIGITKNLLCGQPESNIEELKEDEKIPIKSDEKVQTAENNQIIGYAYQSKQYKDSKRIKPIFVSPGHKISAKTAVNKTEKIKNEYKLPPPIRKADKLVEKIKKGKNNL
ncbi:MAG: endonuclease V [Candidatus Nanohaloarchaea archaeon]